MSNHLEPHRSIVAESIFGILNPLPSGCFFAALIFDIIYSRSAEILWDKGAAWLIVFGLFFAIIPRLLDLTRVWITFRRTATRTDKYNFWLNAGAIAFAIVNAFIHSRDAYASVPTGLVLSICTVIALSAGAVLGAVERATQGKYVDG